MSHISDAWANGFMLGFMIGSEKVFSRPWQKYNVEYWNTEKILLTNGSRKCHKKHEKQTKLVINRLYKYDDSFYQFWSYN